MAIALRALPEELPLSQGPLSQEEIERYKQVLLGMKENESNLLTARGIIVQTTTQARNEEGPRTRGGGEGKGSAARNLEIDLQVAIAVQRTTASNLKAIEVALERIRLGTFGICPPCDEMIPRGRLQLNPSVRCCTPCQAESEC